MGNNTLSNVVGGFTLRPFQIGAVEYAYDFLMRASPGDRLLLAAPTGCGKSLILLALRSRLARGWIVTPRVEIIVGMLAKLGETVEGVGEGALLDLAWRLRITTPVRLRNALLKGEGPQDIEQLLIDEAHHDASATYEQLRLLTGCPAAGVTATPYRGTPRGTLKLREVWGEPEWAITLGEAVKEGYVAIPDCRVVPLVDDETLDIRNGEFAVSAIEGATAGRLADAVRIVAEWVEGDRMKRPSIASLPSREIARQFSAACQGDGIPTVLVTAETTPAERREAFEACVSCAALLVQINVVSEGVDLPCRQLLDLSPTLSPVRWLQQVGRITRPLRPGEDRPLYVCTNRNFLRHAYLLEGLVPVARMVEAQQAFGGVGTRTGAGRAIGLEALGRLRPATLALANGLEGFLYAMSAVEGTTVRQYAVIVHPLMNEPIWAVRGNARGEDGMTVAYGRWERCDPPADLSGFASLPGSQVSEKQLAWWKRSARRHGLNPDVEPTRKQFAALPVLSDLKARIQ